MNFTKMTGAGNDFIVLEADKDTLLFPQLNPENIRLLCDRRYGIGADGLMLIKGQNASDAKDPGEIVIKRLAASSPVAAGRQAQATGEPGTSFSVDFYNADGSGGMLCGNGARCALVYAASRGFIAYDTLSAFSFAGKQYRGIALGPDRARFLLDPRYTTRIEEGIEAAGITIKGRYIDLGSLHLVVDLTELLDGYPDSGSPGGRSQALSLENLDVARIGSAVRNHERFAPSGVNVNFCSLIDGRIHVRTFERGVEAETLACGTGSTASALSYALRGLATPPVQVVTRSGEELIIDFDNAAQPSRLSLEGPAKVVFEGRI